MTGDDSGREDPPKEDEYGLMPSERVPCVPIEELKELADGWDNNTQPHEGSYTDAARELQEIIDDYS